MTGSNLTSNDPLIEFRLKNLETLNIAQDEVIRQLQAELRDNKTHYDLKIQEIKTHYEAQERSRLRWGISSLGTLVSILLGIVWTYRGVIFKGGQ